MIWLLTLLEVGTYYLTIIKSTCGNWEELYALTKIAI